MREVSSAAQFTVTLTSNASLDVYPSNTLASFRTCLSAPIELDGQWEVGLTDITYPRKIFNIRDSKFDFYFYKDKIWVKDVIFPKRVYNTLEDVLGTMRKGIHVKRGKWNKESLPLYFDVNSDDTGYTSLRNSNVVKFANISPDLFHVLGCKKIPSEWQKPPALHDQPFSFPVDINRWHQVYLYADFIEQQFLVITEHLCLRHFLSSIHSTCPPKNLRK